MKIIYIATAITEHGDSIQENAYEDAEQALVQAKIMCDDINRNTNFNCKPDVVPMSFYQQGDVVETPITNDE